MALGFEGYSYRTALGRKRVVLLNNVEASSLNCDSVMPRLKRACSDKFTLNAEKSRLESLPFDVLLRVLCGVDHEDLEQLVHVSQTIKEATEVARIHFEYNTPRKKTFAIRAPFGTDDASEFEDIEPPSAPLRKKPKSRFSGKDLSGISVALFA